MDWKLAKKYWLKFYQTKKTDSEEECTTAKKFVNMFAPKIRWAKSICELGVGTGKHLNFFLERYPDKIYSGNDFNPNTIGLIKKLYPNVIEKCNISINSTDKYLKKYIGLVDAIFTYNHLMYIPNNLIDLECSRISRRATKYILIYEIKTNVSYTESKKSFIKFGIGRDYTDMFDDFNLKGKTTETVSGQEFDTYLFKRI